MKEESMVCDDADALRQAAFLMLSVIRIEMEVRLAGSDFGEFHMLQD